MTDIGSFIEYDFPYISELFENVPVSDKVRLNSCRAAIFHAIRCYGVKKVWVAKYQCSEVINFLKRKGLIVYYYDIDQFFNPLLEGNKEDSAIVLSNYFGILGDNHFLPLLEKFNNIIIDNAQALFYPPKNGCINCYSPRKFVSAPDGAYVIGKNVNRFEYSNSCSSDTAQFLFMRQEYGCNDHAYFFKKQNDYRIQSDDIKLMSPLTLAMLTAVDYIQVKEKRINNFEYAHSLLSNNNQLDLDGVIGDGCVPMGYPLLVDYDIIPIFHQHHIYQPRYWENFLNDSDKKSIEYKFAKYLTLLCIDQKYGTKEIDYQVEIIKSFLMK